ncbi:glycosyltransferase family 2 protein [Actinocorallia sp. A-T 12471]|uniref:glycosyltransferase family 2 protein n=1 Tax=Actinocorallia sp. A-T 12471 TaxID=3089813 RepID=UPI0029CFB749|nr:glycosyltransferase family 2 protein [Actinocorallia sp. A-T 12471]MDX6744648.1 glycosyltransferase family 2 protein [Actinocorallia sp. A-T 12471]
MRTTHVLSVISPVRDVARYVPDLISALAANAAPGFEFLVVDDASSDATGDLLRRARVPGLRVITRPEPGGPSAARNAGLAEASGEYVTFLDGDDWIRPGHLADLVTAIETLRCDFVMTDHIEARGVRRVPRVPPEARLGERLPARGGILPQHDKSMVDYPFTWAGIYRRALGPLLEFDERLHTAEDRPWFWRLYRNADAFAVVRLSGVFYRREAPTALTRVGDARQLHYFDAFDSVLADLDAADEPPELHYKAIRNYCAIMARQINAEARLTPRLRSAQRARAATTLRAFPPDVLASILRGSDPERRTLLEDLAGLTVQPPRSARRAPLSAR